MRKRVLGMTNTGFDFYPFVIMDENNKHYYYNAITSAIYEMDEVSYNILHNRIESEEKPAYQEAIKFMKEHFIIKTEQSDEQLEQLYHMAAEDKINVNPSQLILMVSQDCNLRCSYCYGGDGEYNHKGMMTYEVAKAAVDYLMRFSTKDKLGICFFGGEPLLNFSLIKKIVAYSKEIEATTQKRFSYTMTTNGTIMNPEIEAFIREYDFQINISIDGDAASHNANRYYANMKGCYDDVLCKTSSLRADGRLSARATLSSHNIDIMSTVEHLADLGFAKVAYSPAINKLDTNDLEQLMMNQKQAMDRMERLLNEENLQEAAKYHQILGLLKKVHQEGVKIRSCGAGVNMIAVSIDGDMYPCHRFVGNKSSKLGHIMDNTLCHNEWFYDSINISKVDKCSDCISKNVCIGGCPQEAYECSVNHDLPGEAYCDYKRQTLKDILSLYVRLDKTFRKRLFSQKIS